MATVAAINAVLDPAGQGKGPFVLVGPLSTDPTLDEYYVFGGVGSKTPSWTGKWIQTTRAASAAVQGAAMLALLNT